MCVYLYLIPLANLEISVTEDNKFKWNLGLEGYIPVGTQNNFNFNFSSKYSGFSSEKVEVVNRSTNLIT